MSNRFMWRVLSAQALSSLGSSVSTVALAVMVFQITGSVLHMGGVLAASTVPLVVMSFAGGALVDRFSARSLMVIADVARGCLTLLMPLLAIRSVAFIYLIASAIGMFSSVFNPSQVKVVADIVPRERLVRWNSYLSISRDGAELVGYLVGAVMVSLLGFLLTFVIDATSYFASALLLLGLPRRSSAQVEGRRFVDLVAESPAVLVRLWRDPSLRTNLLLAVFPMMVVMMSVPNAYGLALQVYDKGPTGLAILEVVTASGLIVGGVLASRFSFASDKNRYVFFSSLAMACCFIGVSFSGFFWLAVGLIGMAAIANVGIIVPSITMFQEIPSRPDRGRLIAIRAGFGQLGTTVGLLLGGAVGAALGIERLFMIAGVAGISLSLLIYVPYRAWVRRGGSDQDDGGCPEVSSMELGRVTTRSE